MDTEIILGNSAYIPVRLLSSTTFTPITGISAPTVFIHKYGSNTTISKSITNGTNWKEVDATNFPGVYDLLLSESDTDTLGILKVSVKFSTTDFFIGTYNIVGSNSYVFANDMKLLRKMSMNRTKIDTTTNTFTLYDDDRSTPIIQYSLLDDTQTPTVASIFERVPAPFGVDGKITQVSSGTCTFTSPTLDFTNIIAGEIIHISSTVYSANLGQFTILTVGSNSLTYTNSSGIIDTSGTIIFNIHT
jgi:hypothetical protein